MRALIADDDPEFLDLIAGALEQVCGDVVCAASGSELLAERVSARAVESGFDSLLDYYYFLRYDPGGAAELDALVEHLVVQETYLFREVDQLRGRLRVAQIEGAEIGAAIGLFGVGDCGVK